MEVFVLNVEYHAKHVIQHQLIVSHVHQDIIFIKQIKNVLQTVQQKIH